MYTIQKIYFAEHPVELGGIVAIKHRETGYNTTDVKTKEEAVVLNERQGITPGEVAAAVQCSMFNCWDSFDELSQRM